MRLALEGAFASREATPVTVPARPPRRRIIAIVVSSVVAASAITALAAYAMIQWTTKPPKPGGPDGQRFLMIKDTTPATQPSTPPGLVVVLNWFEELKGRIPAK